MQSSTFQTVMSAPSPLQSGCFKYYIEFSSYIRYREAGKITNLVLQGLMLQVKPGAKVLDLCKCGDMVITQKCGTIYQKKVKGKVIEKGIAFPTRGAELNDSYEKNFDTNKSLC